MRVPRTCSAKQICLGVDSFLRPPAREHLRLEEVGAADIFLSHIEDDGVFLRVETGAVKEQGNS